MTPYVISSFSGEYEFLSNFYNFPINFPVPGGNQITFATNEHAFQAAKFKVMIGSDNDKKQYVQSCLDAPTPSKAKYAGRLVKIDLSEWERTRIDVMREICLIKFNEPKMKEALSSTGHAMLVEGNTHGDKFWGRCEGAGYNMLGVILMEIRGYHRLDSTG